VYAGIERVVTWTKTTVRHSSVSPSDIVLYITAQTAGVGLTVQIWSHERRVEESLESRKKSSCIQSVVVCRVSSCWSEVEAMLRCRLAKEQQCMPMPMRFTTCSLRGGNGSAQMPCV